MGVMQAHVMMSSDLCELCELLGAIRVTNFEETFLEIIKLGKIKTNSISSYN